MNELCHFSKEELVMLAQAGREDAEEHLIREHKELVKVKAYTYFIVGAEMEDVVQEGMIGLFKAIKTYERGHDATFTTYASHCITRQILDAIKAANRKKHGPLNSSISLNKPTEEGSAHLLQDTILMESSDDPATSLMMKDFMEAMAESINREFTKLEGQVWKGYMGGFTCVEIGKALGKDTKAVYNAMERAKKKILYRFEELQF